MNHKIVQTAISDIIALSPIQAGMLFHLLQDPTTEAYVEKVRIDLKGNIDDSAFIEAWKSLGRMHDSLRTVFRWDKIHQPVQVILKEKEIRVEIRKKLPDQEIEYNVIENIDIQKDPFRIILIKDTSSHVLWLIYSHILLDGWSISILMSDFLNCYERLIKKESLEGLKRPSFKSYITYLTNRSLEKPRAYWKQFLQGSSITQHILPDILEEHSSSQKRFGWLHQPIDKTLTSQIHHLAKSAEVSIATVFYLGWAIILKRYSHSKDVLFGISLSHRNCPLENVEKIVGLLINTIPVRIQFGLGNKIKDLLEIIQKQFLESQENACLSLVEIKKALGVQAQQELFDSLLVVENYPIPNSSNSTSGLSIASFSNKEFTHFPLTLIVDLLGEACLKISYQSSSFSQAMIQQIGKHFLLVLKALVMSENGEIDSFEALPSDEIEQIQLFNRTKHAYPQKETLVDLFREQVRKSESQPALVYGSTSLTYRDLDELSDGLAARLSALQIGVGEKIGISMSKGPQMIVALLSILKAKGAYVSISPDLPEIRKDYIIKDCSIRYVIHSSQGSSLPEIKEIFQGLFKSAEEYHENDSPLCYVLYSSGSTGTPKGILIDQRGIVRLVKNTNFIEFLPRDRILSTCPLDFDVSGLEIWGALLNGSMLYLVDDKSLLMTDHIKNVLKDGHINKLWLSTPLFNAWVNEDISLFENFEYVIVGGDILSPFHIVQVQAKYPKLRIVNGYGPTENSVISTAFEIPPIAYKRIPIGKPIANSTAYIVDEEGRLQPVGAVGEIWLGGDGVALGYLNKHDLSAEKFIPNPFGSGTLFKSGDLGRWLPDGSIDFLGRKDFQVKVRGYRIEIPEIEIALKAHPSVGEAIVNVEEGSTDKELVAYIQKKSFCTVTELKEHLSLTLPHYFIPSLFVFIDIFPLTTTGKIDRKEFKKFRNSIQPNRPTDSEVPETELEKMLHEIYSHVLQKSSISITDNFFDMGGNSLHTIQIRSLIQKKIKREIPITDIFQFPTISSLAKHLNQTSNVEEERPTDQNREKREDLAIIGLSGRFPGASSPSVFWKKLKEGTNLTRRFSTTELEEVPEETLQHPNYVPVKGALEEVEYFDHHFFGYSEREAELMDPQLRLLHECCWEVLEDAGYACDPLKANVGLFVGSEVNIHWINSLMDHLEEPTELWQAAHYNTHSMSTSVSYKLNLRGPSLTIDTACSSSLVAIHQAKLSIWAGECQMAIAGGVSLELPKRSGYIYEEGMIRSRDGLCRAFDKDASGTISGDGIGLVLLKPLSLALRDGDHVYAVLKGSAINNDGNRKVGYTAPSISGQADVIKMALEDAQIAPSSVSYIETHGTGTILGDPIEIKALSSAYSKASSIGIGSVKTNIGHLNTAAGVAGFIKTVLALYHQYLPATLNFNEPNLECHFSETPFKVISKGSFWNCHSSRFAGVSSFGIGGTNAHAILGEPPRERSKNVREQLHLFVLSAKSQTALKRNISSLQELILENKYHLGDIVYTLQRGRSQFSYRLGVICSNLKEAYQRLSEAQNQIHEVSQKPKIAFVFQGQGGQEFSLDEGIYAYFPILKNYINRALTFLNQKYAVDLSPYFFPTMLKNWQSPLNRTQQVQITNFIVSYGLAICLQDLGISPFLSLGHSVGEFVAACLAEVFTYEDGLELLMERGRLMGMMPQGKMVALRTNLEMLCEMLNKYPSVNLAAENSPEDYVLSGDPESISEVIKDAQAKKIPVFVLNTNLAFHSNDLLLIKDELLHLFSRFKFQKPKQRYLSCLTGEMIIPEEVILPTYWFEHSFKIVNFSKAIQRLQDEDVSIIIEVGPSKQLNTLIQRQLKHPDRCSVYSCFAHPSEKKSLEESMLQLILNAWLAGVNIDWNKLESKNWKRVSLPTYAFDRHYFWKFGTKRRFLQIKTHHQLRESGSYLLEPTWASYSYPISGKENESSCDFWVIHGGTVLDSCLIEKLRLEGFVKEVRLASLDIKEFKRCFEDKNLVKPKKLIFTFFTSREGHLSNGVTDVKQNLFMVIEFIQLSYQSHLLDNIEIDFVVSSFFEQSFAYMVAALAKSLYVENLSLAVRYVEIESEPQAIHVLVSEILRQPININSNHLKIDSKGHIFQQGFAELDFEFSKAKPFRTYGVYLLTGGLGGIGLVIAEYLATHFNANLILLGRSVLSDWMKSVSSATLKRFENIKKHANTLNYEILDVSDKGSVDRIVEQTLIQFNNIHGIIHLSGVIDDSLFLTKTKEGFEKVFAPKIEGAINLVQALVKLQLKPDFVLFGSSIASVRGDYGQSAYVLANAFLNGYASQCKRETQLPVLSINWDTWKEVGMARRSYDTLYAETKGDSQTIHKINLSADTDWFLFEHLLKGKAILPGSGFISLLVQEVCKFDDSLPIYISNIQFLSPLMVENFNPISLELKVDLTNDTRQKYRFSFSRTVRGEEIVYCEGAFDKEFILHSPPLFRSIDRTVFSKRVTFARGIKQSSHMTFGSRWNNIKEVEFSSSHGGLASLYLHEDFQDDLSNSPIHAALLDTATSFLLDVLDVNEDILPFAYNGLAIYKSFTPKMYSYLKPKTFEHTSDVQIFQVQLFDEHFDCCLEGEILFKKIPKRMSYANYSIHLERVGDLSSLQIKEIVREKELKENEIEIEVLATGLNFKEILFALGMIPSLPGLEIFKFGLEMSGIIVKTGKNVSRFKPGDAVLGMVDGGFDRFIIVNENEVVFKPDTLTFEQAATVPVAFLTAYYGLIEAGELKRKDKVLIHSATGGVGLAAIEIAKKVGAEIYVTVGNDEKRKYIEQKGVKGVFSSKNEDFLQGILKQTERYGVDIVLNSTTGSMLTSSLKLVAPYGKFVEIGIKDLVENTSLGMGIFQKSITFSALSISQHLPNYLESMESIVKTLERGEWTPLPITIFSLDEITSAFSYMASGKHIGKIVIAHRDLKSLNLKYSNPQYRHVLSNPEGLSSFIQSARLASQHNLSEIYVTKQKTISLSARFDETSKASPIKNGKKKTRPMLSVKYIPPMSETQTSLTRIMGDFLGIDQIGIDDNFNELGLSSLDVIQVKSHLAKSLSVEIPIVQFYTYPTVAKLSDWIEKQLYKT